MIVPPVHPIITTDSFAILKKNSCTVFINLPNVCKLLLIICKSKQIIGGDIKKKSDFRNGFEIRLTMVVFISGIGLLSYVQVFGHLLLCESGGFTLLL